MKGYPYTRKEAIRKMLDGTPMQAQWQTGKEHYSYEAYRAAPFLCFDSYGEISGDTIATDCVEWRIYEEPKKLVEKWLWVARYKNDTQVELCSGFYSSEKELLESIDDGWVVICRADWSKIEVPE